MESFRQRGNGYACFICSKFSILLFAQARMIKICQHFRSYCTAYSLTLEVVRFFANISASVASEKRCISVLDGASEMWEDIERNILSDNDAPYLPISLPLTTDSDTEDEATRRIYRIEVNGSSVERTYFVVRT